MNYFICFFLSPSSPLCFGYLAHWMMHSARANVILGILGVNSREEAIMYFLTKQSMHRHKCCLSPSSTPRGGRKGGQRGINSLLRKVAHNAHDLISAGFCAIFSTCCR